MHLKRSHKVSYQAAIAQLVEHFIRNEKVVGSSPTRGSKSKKEFAAHSGEDYDPLLGISLKFKSSHTYGAIFFLKKSILYFCNFL